ncbi:hypothetical protein RUM43_007661 [Polyplax serrata]|uniref:Uncharacterized protein n=1 Tax=Polyplax serrata TaxID=468196 RepID=A0AAN8Q6B8_POLSC
MLNLKDVYLVLAFLLETALRGRRMIKTNGWGGPPWQTLSLSVFWHMNNSKPALEKSKLDNVRAPKVFHKLHDSKSGFIIAYTYQVQSKKTLLAAKVSST